MSDINTSHSELNLSNTSVTSNSLDIPDTLSSSIPDTTDSAVKNIFSSSSSQLQEPSSSSSIPTQECVDTESISHENIYDVAFYRQKVKRMKTSQIQDLIKNVF